MRPGRFGRLINGKESNVRPSGEHQEIDTQTGRKKSKPRNSKNSEGLLEEYFVQKYWRGEWENPLKIPYVWNPEADPDTASNFNG